MAVLEVGLGGRLDAVNILDADVSVITTVDIDHQAYLGDDREAIGLEKAGIMRPGKPCILGEKDPPSSVLRHAYAQGVYCVRGYSDYLIDLCRRALGMARARVCAGIAVSAAESAGADPERRLRDRRLARLNAAHQSTGLGRRHLPAKIIGRLQHWRSDPEVILDVAHNRQSVAQLALWLESNPKPTNAVFCALKDKDIPAMIEALRPFIGLLACRRAA